MIHYVNGFLLNREKNQVVIIQKTKPEWQKGLYNGVGGKIEWDENNFAAMSREFQEETGVYIAEKHWEHYLIYKALDKSYEVNFFACHDKKNIFVPEVRTTTEEKICTVPTHEFLRGLWRPSDNADTFLQLYLRGFKHCIVEKDLPQC